MNNTFIKIGKNNYNKHNIDFYRIEKYYKEDYVGHYDGISMHRTSYCLLIKICIKGIEYTEDIKYNCINEREVAERFIESELNN